MPPRRLRVFVSSTSRDLSRHRRIVREVIASHGCDAVMMEDFGSLHESTVEACVNFVRSCDVVVALIAHRRGWLPSVDQGGDGVRSVTMFELDAARAAKIPIHFFLSKQWPGELWETQADAQNAMAKLRDELNQPAGFFRPGPANADSDDREPEPSVEFAHDLEKLFLKLRGEQLGTLEANLSSEAPAHLRTLLPILQAYPNASPHYATAYRRSTPTDWESASSTSADHGVVFARDLSRAIQQTDGSIPLVDFVQTLHQLFTTADGPQELLAKWLETARLALRAPAMAVTTVTTNPPDRLIVRIDTNAFAREQYSVEAWLSGPQFCEKIYPDDPTKSAHTADTLPTVIDAIRSRCIDRLENPSSLIVECYLPRELLCAEPDRWPITLDFGLGENPLGFEHLLIIRPIDRYKSTGKSALSALRTRAAIFRDWLDRTQQNCPDDPPAWATATAVRIRRGSAGGRALYNQLSTSNSAVCVILEEPPRGTIERGTDDILNATLLAGLPVLIWLREGCPVEAGIPITLATQILRAFPEWVWDQRCTAENLPADEPHFGRHLTLVWDDPERPPPDHTPATLWRAPR